MLNSFLRIDKFHVYSNFIFKHSNIILKVTYNIVFDKQLIFLKKYLSETNTNRCFVLMDKNTFKHCFPLFKKAIKIKYECIVLNAGEENKNLKNVEKVIDFLMKNNAEKNNLFICLGGGVITDLGGFAAAIFKRGMRCVYIPTSLMAMADAAIGGKTGVDFSNVKNAVGLIKMPEKIFIENSFLKTLPKNEFINGYAEILKHQILQADKIHLEKSNPIVYLGKKKELEKAVNFKFKIVSKDAEEKNTRKILNFGHTAGHAIESILIKTRKHKGHGFAVAAGMVIELMLSVYENNYSEKKAENYINYILKIFGKIESLDKKQILNYLEKDKKNKNSKINFTLLDKTGKPKTDCFPSLQNINKALDFYLSI